MKVREASSGVSASLISKIKDMDIDEPTADDVNLANAVNLSESEDEVEEEQITGDFFTVPDPDFVRVFLSLLRSAYFFPALQDSAAREDKIYFFQFPPRIPTFISPLSMITEPSVPTVDKGKGKAVDAPKKVTFAIQDGLGSGATTPTTKPEDATTEKAPESPVDGIIGQLELYRSGVIKMRLANGILLDASFLRSSSLKHRSIAHFSTHQVSAATQSSFLQQAVHIDKQKKKLCVLGEVNRRFIVTPDIDALLADLSVEPEGGLPGLEEEGLITMDIA